jgi:hypothetical protein
LVSIAVVAGAGKVINLLGFASISAVGITSALAAIGSVVGMGMLADAYIIAVCDVVVGKVFL